VNFETLVDFKFTYETNGEQVTMMHNGATGVAPKFSHMSDLELLARRPEFYDSAPKDIVVVPPGNPDTKEGFGTIIRAYFPNTGSYVWHCHILRYVQRKPVPTSEKPVILTITFPLFKKS